MGRRAVPLTVTADDRVQQEPIARSQSLPAALARRAQMVLRLANGETNNAVAERYKVSRPTVSLWRKRYAEHGLSGLHNELKPGRSSSMSENATAELVQTAPTRKPTARTQWSRCSLAEETGLFKSTVARLPVPVRRAAAPQEEPQAVKQSVFHREGAGHSRVVPESTEPRAGAVRGRESQYQALERTQPVLPMGLGYVEGIKHDYIRHGTTTPFAALDVANGTVLAQCKPKHRHQEFLAFLCHIEANVPEPRDMHLICDSYGAHKHARAGAWLARRPRVHRHFMPICSSWLNQVERWFALIANQAIRRGTQAQD